MPHDGKKRPDKVGATYTVGRKLGRGSFGSIYLAVNSQSGEELAVKVEKKRSKSSMLQHESNVAKALAGGAGIPAIHFCDMEGENTVMVMDLLGPSLEDLFCMCERKFSVRTVAMIAGQVLTRIEWVHSKSFVHRDIKPENFLVGRGSNDNLIHLIDFGLAKLYRDPQTRAHINYKANKSLTGTARYASIHAHLGAEQGRRDDLEAVGYMLLYFLRGRLPWQGFTAKTKEEKYAHILESKQTTPVETLCSGLPETFLTYQRYCRELPFAAQPDYPYLRGLFTDLLDRCEDPGEDTFDWQHTQRATQGSESASCGETKGLEFQPCRSTVTRVATLGATSAAEYGLEPPVARKSILGGFFSSLCSRGVRK
uniref:Casein kinase I n=1 Tax=Alexandrium catenella TaxID=2925 RepID=A0A7S1M4R6_ALECA|mmetsp:Transcript_2002/g.5309  ORF Transcript_2002/g.5309 Transcript_2002/m.5309 type:complete len:368 (+) Transcript_2002:116-1219(+)